MTRLRIKAVLCPNCKGSGKSRKLCIGCMWCNKAKRLSVSEARQWALRSIQLASAGYMDGDLSWDDYKGMLIEAETCLDFIAQLEATRL